MTSNIDEEKLAEAYNRALVLEKSGKLEEAAAAYREVLTIDPDDHGGAAVRLAAIGFGEIPSKAPDAYVETLFDQHAEDFEDILVDQLGYCVPMIIRQRMQTLQAGPFARMLDLGCGTGLGASAMRDMVEDITGLDISENMVEIAYEKEIYETLFVAEVEDFLHENDEDAFDLIVAADVLPYLGTLDALFSGAAANSTPGGLFAFSAETLPDDVLRDRPYMVGPHHRFGHSLTYLKDGLARFGFWPLDITDINVRFENGEPTPGYLVIARYSPA
ncbi:methyltransferase domain-containing protein [Martelella mediterranea]|uniref:2-polyprenyl-6-hydroxyphenyl methylase/3-demethylubiquinone-9 3-methyltransferase n=1 Tax=Martelella mediterranea TaxID=293089 RepID=A0A4R3NRA2_9HYPH|nr:methyltransferase domain-containing protein [Martelella mediterranea]TCT38817.1 2-polyprenyl-6-hydroxyphenyl methylase/3-demethylubiquinone-9 3-methyltransferase [Martelella mediterranea]